MALAKRLHRLSLNIVAFKNTPRPEAKKKNHCKGEENSSLKIKAIADHSLGTHTPH